MVETQAQIRIREELKPLLDSQGLEVLLTRSAFLLDKIASTEYHSVDVKADYLSGELSLLRYSGLVGELITNRSPLHLTPKVKEIHNQIKESGFYQSNAVE